MPKPPYWLFSLFLGALWIHAKSSVFILSSRWGKGEGRGKLRLCSTLKHCSSQVSTKHLEIITNKTNLYLVPTLFISMVACACIFFIRVLHQAYQYFLDSTCTTNAKEKHIWLSASHNYSSMGLGQVLLVLHVLYLCLDVATVLDVKCHTCIYLNWRLCFILCPQSAVHPLYWQKNSEKKLKLTKIKGSPSGGPCFVYVLELTILGFHLRHIKIQKH